MVELPADEYSTLTFPLALVSLVVPTKLRLVAVTNRPPLLEIVRLPLLVRNRRRGDRFQPLGSPGRRKLQDLFVDRKVPRGERDRVPVVVDSEGHVVWVVGVAVSERCRVRSPEDAVLLLKQRKRE